MKSYDIAEHSVIRFTVNVVERLLFCRNQLHSVDPRLAIITR